MTDDDLFLPEPEPREVLATIISVDDHLVEPADMFDGRLPAALQDKAPRIVVDRRGHEVWEFDGQRHSQVGMNAVVGRRPETVEMEPFRFDQMRRGCYDVDARVHDMDLAGIWASLSFPSMITGFCGRVYSQCSDPDLGLATTRAFNDWVHDAWWQPHPHVLRRAKAAGQSHTRRGHRRRLDDADGIRRRRSGSIDDQRPRQPGRARP